MLDYRPARPGTTSRGNRGRTPALIVGAIGLAAVLITGLVLSLLPLLPGSPGSGSAAPASSDQVGVNPQIARARDELAARAMPEVGTGHEFGWPQLSTRDPGPVLSLPPAAGVDRLGVARGFPRTPLGALAQLVAIDTAALESASLPGVRAVIREWAAPGGPTPGSWSGVRAMGSLLSSAGVSGAGSADLRVRVVPAMGLIKGQVGDDFVVACVDLSLDITFGGTTATVAADCQRLLWQSGRWVIGPGDEPAAVAQVWPDTEAAIETGFRDLVRS